MHTALSTHVLALAPDSLASLGQLDLDSLSELWSLFTRCKDNLQNGRRLENLSWRLWYESGGCRRDGEPFLRSAQGSPKVDEADWSDPEWEEASDTDSAGGSYSSADEEVAVPPASPPRTRASPPSTSTHKPSSPSVSPQSATATSPSRGRTSTAAPARPPLARRGVSREWGGAPVISGGSLQRMIADLQRLPEIPVPGRARSVDGAALTSNGLNKPPLGSRGSSAPDNLNAASLQASRAASPTPAADLTRSSSSASTSARQRSRANSPSISRSASTPTANAPEEAHQPAPPPPPAPPNRRVPSGLAMSTMPAQSAAARRPAAVSPSPPTPADEPAGVIRMTPSETAMLALSNSRNRSDLSLSRRAQSTAELAASCKPASFVKGFEPSPPQARQQAQVQVPASVEARPGPGAIAPPPTPATNLASLGPSPPKSALKSPSSTSSSRSPRATPAKVPPPPSSAVQAAGPGPSAFTRKTPCPPTGDRAKKIFFISSPESDEEGSRSSGGRGGGSAGMKVVGSPPSAMKKHASAAETKGKGKEVQNGKEQDEEDEWASETETDEEEEEEDDDDSSGWGSEYSTESDIARDSARRGGAGGGAGGFDSTNLFAKQRTASTATLNNGANTGGPGELTRRPPGLLSQLFHPDQFIDDSDRNPSSANLMRRNHKSMSALPTLGRLQSEKSAGPGRLGANGRSKSFLKGKPEHVELESSSDEGEGYGRRGAGVAEEAEEGEEEEEDEYEDVDADAEAKAAAAAALARRQRELEEVVAPPQTPRTTRRAMLATELSESLRRNLLWERQTRNRIMGGMPRRPTMPGEPLPQRPPSSTNLAAAMQQQGPPSAPAVPPSQLQQPHQPTVTRAQTDEGGVRAPNPSPATRHSPPLSKRSPPQRPHPPQHHHTQHAPRHPGTTNLPRRHTTGTGLYLQALNGGAFRRARAADTDSELSQSSDDEDDGRASPADVFGSSIGGQRVW
ncbi:DUF1752 family protein [Rhodotorula toruloides]|uniref:BY PROTMAP: gi/472588648/gb/EMS26120.1/ DUF1752 family protein [Rhodosporidium toruloides NP11] gi/647396437/emb/CDR38637.1/ RHTO0S03e11628g1_1 [Rhodosporidium toruloides] n=1 Tax=Rhodotorula toruloides TaxID=5286 RepID=A0A0K3CS61_RHOTO|nr:DUF1752 family protein [Rhodotorula toruloides]PRQ69960.1 hypothetical protein AAT19DRAFT_11613 [Rhodotorula toruloides]